MNTLNYDEFATNCVEELKLLQSNFQNKYDVDWYDKWFYSQSTGLLTFSTGDLELNFKYISIGSFSENSKTWKWSWDNETTLENVKGPVRAIKEFGEKSDFSKLTTGCFVSDESEAWAFVAIAAKLLNGIGVYRPVADKQLKLFLVITEYIDNDTANKIKDKYIQCGLHEYRRIAFVCQHLNHSTKVGFVEAFETYEGMELPEEDDFQAWCNECEMVRKREGEWNENSEAFAQIKLVCEDCYFAMKTLNLQPDKSTPDQSYGENETNQRSPNFWARIKNLFKS